MQIWNQCHLGGKTRNAATVLENAMTAAMLDKPSHRVGVIAGHCNGTVYLRELFGREHLLAVRSAVAHVEGHVLKHVVGRGVDRTIGANPKALVVVKRDDHSLVADDFVR